MASDVTVESINRAKDSLSKGENIREEMALVVSPHANWENFLSPAPMCICLLGELMVLSTTADFTLENTPPRDGFKLMRWPSSFRASLMQVANWGYEAFSEAHTSMDQIRLLSLNVPVHMREAVKILLKGTNEEVEDLLPIQLKAIEKVADEGLLLATSVEAKFNAVMSLTAELLEACVGARGKYEVDLQETKIALEIANKNKNIAEERKQMSTKVYKELEKSVKDAEKSYYSSLDSMPSGWQIIGMNVVEGIGDAFVNVLSGISRAFTSETEDSRKPRQSRSPKSAEPVPSRMSLDDGTIKSYQKAILLKTYTDVLIDATIKDGKLKTSIEPNDARIPYAERQFSNLLKDVHSLGKNAATAQIINLLKEGLDIVGHIKKIQRNFQVQANEDTKSSLAERILSFYQSVVAIESEGKALLWSSPTNMRAPNQRVMPTVPDTDGSAAQQHIQNTRFKIQQAAAQLEFVRDKYDKACDNLQESNQKLGDVIAELAKLDIQKIDFEKIRKTLIKGIKALGELRGQWGKLVMFFQMISNLIRCSLNTSLEGFTATARKSQEHALKGYPVTALRKDLIYQQAFHASKLAHVVNMISECYVKISSDHLMKRIAGLGKLLGFDPATDATEILREREALHQSSAKAQNEIRALVLKHKREFDEKVERRIRRIKEELENALPQQILEPRIGGTVHQAIGLGIKHAKEIEETVKTSSLDPDDFV